MTADLISTSIGIIKIRWSFFYFKFDYLKQFHDKLEQFKNIKSTLEKSEQKIFVYDNASDLYYSLLVNYEQQ